MATKKKTAAKKAPAKKPAAKPAAKAAPKKAAPKKAAAKKAPAKKAAKRKANPALLKPVQPDAVLGAVVGSKPASRGQITKKLWDYIKKNGLQDAKNKRAINADAKLQKVFGKPQVTMFELAGLIGKHLQ